VARKSEVQWGVGGVDRRFRRGPHTCPVLGEEDDQFFDCAHDYSGYPEMVLLEKTLMFVAKR
jgi:hypothetical protein